MVLKSRRRSNSNSDFNMNSVTYLKKNSFSLMKIEQKLEIKKLGPPCPEIKSKHKGRNFSSDWYKKCGWLAGCELTEKVYCFPCLLFGYYSHVFVF